jgi:hypothetical protein
MSPQSRYLAAACPFNTDNCAGQETQAKADDEIQFR